MASEVAQTAVQADAPRRSVSPHVWVPSTYFAEGFPYAVVNSIAEVFFQAAGASLGAIGLTSLFHAPYNLKFLWAPLLDRVGTKRAWMVGLQLGLGLGLLGLAFVPAAESALPWASALFVALAVLSATNDVAIDGYYMDALDDAAQSRFVGYRATAYKVATLLVKGPLLGLVGLVGFSFGFLAMGLLQLAVAGLHAFLLPRPTAVVQQEVVRRSALVALLQSERIFVVLPFVVLFRTGESLLQKMKWPFLHQSLGLSVSEYALSSGTVGAIASFAGTFVGGMAIARLGLARCFWPFLLAQNVLNLLYVGLAWLPGAIPVGASATPHVAGLFWVVTGALTLEEFGAGLGTAVLMVFLMQKCQAAHRATHFAILTALMSLSFTIAGSVSGFLAERLGYAAYFGFTFLATLPMMALGLFVPRGSALARS